MSRHDWKPAAAEASESGRCVISLYVSAAEPGEDPVKPVGGETAEALQNAIYPLDVRWTAGMGRPTAPIRKDNAYGLAAQRDDAIRLVSSGTADLFGMTPASAASVRLFDLIRASGNVDALQRELEKLHAPAVLAYGRLADALAKLRSTVSFELAAPAGGRIVAELDRRQLEEASAYIDETRIETVLLRIRGQLTDLNPSGKSFRLEADDGELFAGRLARDIRQRYGKTGAVPNLPVLSEACIERRTAYRVRLGTLSIVDTLTELDADPGLNRDETLPTFRRARDRLRAALEQDGGYEASSPISAADYAALAGLIGRVLDSNPLKGVRRELEPGDLAEASALLAETKPVGRLALLEGSGYEAAGDESDGYEPDPGARAARLRAAADRHKLAAAAYADAVKLAGRLSRMIEALEDEATG
ncbi:hypothetical protein [Paenibacillus glycinis]|uniref:Uncharacterized protein n=1 Tax=Paenibacillus glycinis TaxID=2697035 RepID=A0ABW9XYC3_9BACL|nr:hypothetical protein [Paenibacillus glycinis]NBD27728.1 hypothetical protein [Paenibacillus glycinis]